MALIGHYLEISTSKFIGIIVVMCFSSSYCCYIKSLMLEATIYKVSVSPNSDSLAARQMIRNERNQRANTVNENAAIHRDLKDTTAVIKIR
jgi:hypothetical protein